VRGRRGGAAGGGAAAWRAARRIKVNLQVSSWPKNRVAGLWTQLVAWGLYRVMHLTCDGVHDSSTLAEA
jgi:hypothetical protein